MILFPELFFRRFSSTPSKAEHGIKADKQGHFILKGGI